MNYQTTVLITQLFTVSFDTSFLFCREGWNGRRRSIHDKCDRAHVHAEASIKIFTAVYRGFHTRIHSRVFTEEGPPLKLTYSFSLLIELQGLRDKGLEGEQK